MQNANELQSPLRPSSLTRRAIIGAGIGLLLIGIFLLGVKNPNPNWPKLWMLRPLVIVPLAGATGGAVYYFLDYLRYQNGWNANLVKTASLLIFLIGLWMGIVLGLDGTLWN
ncbi:potassium transporter KefB [Larkinella terrae]|uniref:Potassium transporter KefB n=1 Tax=Larkinella terrae TaxID=2025311 RepID=A0A7K0EL19_9BACT|nr:potassium transporter KefB [Larkinella terrae]MRS62148.1 potassium transporter KefB [Larkinella terrae]